MSRWACRNHNFAFEGHNFAFVEAKRTKQRTSKHNKTIAKSAPSFVIYDISDSDSWSSKCTTKWGLSQDSKKQKMRFGTLRRAFQNVDLSLRHEMSRNRKNYKTTSAIPRNTSSNARLLQSKWRPKKNFTSPFSKRFSELKMGILPFAGCMLCIAIINSRIFKKNKLLSTNSFLEFEVSKESILNFYPKVG